MILAEVRKQLKKDGQGTVQSLAAELGEDQSMIEVALDFWMKKGNVELCDSTDPEAKCGTVCKACPVADIRVKTQGVQRFSWRD
jgi:hypothetical protein